MRQNVRYCNVTELILAKQREQEQADKAKMDRSVETFVCLVTLGVIWTVIGLYVAWQEGLLP